MDEESNCLKFCGLDGKWVIVDCPPGTKAGMRDGKLGCFPVEDATRPAS